MRTIRCLEDLRCLRRSDLDPTLLDALEEDFRKQMVALRFVETEEEFSLIEHGYIVLLEKGDNLHDLREVGLCPMNGGLFGTSPEFIETLDIGGKCYFKNERSGEDRHRKHGQEQWAENAAEKAARANRPSMSNWFDPWEECGMDQVIAWLLQADPWVRYGTLLDLLGKAEDDPEVEAARRDMLAHPKVRGILAAIADWPGRVMNNHKAADHPVHKLTFLADLGLRATDPGMGAIVARVCAHQSPKGPFEVLMNIPVHFGGTGDDQWAWALCDAPLLLYALVKFGLGGMSSVQAAASYLAELVRENGWPCTGDLGKFRGPGRKDDPCPYANLAMLKALACLPDWHDSKQARIGVETQLQLWATRRERHPYMFYMGTDFCKLKAPFVWYDILHVLEVLTQFPWSLADARLQEMAAIVRAKADGQGRFTPESVWKTWSDWEFGWKKNPSPWLTFLTYRVLTRMAA